MMTLYLLAYPIPLPVQLSILSKLIEGQVWYCWRDVDFWIVVQINMIVHSLDETIAHEVIFRNVVGV